MTTAPSCSLPRTHSADLPGDHCRCHRQEAEALWSPRFGPDLMSTERKLPSGLPSTPPPPLPWPSPSFLWGCVGMGSERNQKPEQPRPHPDPTSWLQGFTWEIFRGQVPRSCI